jgi:hypothetical protein
MFRWNPESSAKAWILRMAIGPAMVVDGICHFFSLGCFSAGCSLAAARKLAKTRTLAQ